MILHEAQSASQNSEQNVVSENQQMENTGKGYVFSYDGTEVDTDVTAYVDKFGEPASYYESSFVQFSQIADIKMLHNIQS